MGGSLYKNVFFLPVGTLARNDLIPGQSELFTELGIKARQILDQRVNRIHKNMLTGFRPPSLEGRVSSSYFNRGFNQEVNYDEQRVLNPVATSYLKMPSFEQQDIYTIMRFMSSTYREQDNVVIFAHQPIFEKVLPSLLHRLQIDSLINTNLDVGVMMYVYGNLKRRENVNYKILSALNNSQGGKIISLNTQ